jgi:muconate cycloisomerase
MTARNDIAGPTLAYRQRSCGASSCRGELMNVRVERVRMWEVVVPARAGFVDSATMTSSSSTWPDLPICLVELTFSDGISGLGELARGTDLATALPWAKRILGRPARELSASALPIDSQHRSALGLIEMLPKALWDTNPFEAAVHTAMLDWRAKRAGCRVVDLLGGTYRENIPVDYWCGRQTPADLSRTVTRARELGFSGLKMKSQLGDPILEQVHAIRKAGGDDFHITVDPMFQWLSPKDVMGSVKLLEPHAGVLRIEDPFPQDMPEHWRRLRNSISIPLVWHARNIDSLRRALQENCADAFNCGGGVQEFLTLAHAVEVAGYSCWHGSAMELGVSQVAHLHVAAASRSCVLSSDCVSSLIREHSLITWNWPYQNGKIGLPHGNGLGIELDHQVIKHFQQNFIEISQSSTG